MEKQKQENLRENHRQIFKKNIFTLKNFNKILFLIIIVSGVYYIAGTNDLSIKGMALSDLKQERNRLVNSNNKLELQAMTLSSYDKISQRVGDLRMVAVGEINYINGVSEAVAKK